MIARRVHSGYFGLASLLAAVGMLHAAATAHAAQLLVPSQYPTIQAAIDAAFDGDEVVIADGLYTGTGNTGIRLAAKAITVRSASGDPATCVI